MKLKHRLIGGLIVITALSCITVHFINYYITLKSHKQNLKVLMQISSTHFQSNLTNHYNLLRRLIDSSKLDIKKVINEMQSINSDLLSHDYFYNVHTNTIIDYIEVYDISSNLSTPLYTFGKVPYPSIRDLERDKMIAQDSANKPYFGIISNVDPRFANYSCTVKINNYLIKFFTAVVKIDKISSNFNIDEMVNYLLLSPKGEMRTSNQLYYFNTINNFKQSEKFVQSSLIIPAKETTLSDLNKRVINKFNSDPTLNSITIEDDDFINFYERIPIKDDELIEGSSQGLFYRIIFNSNSFESINYNSFYAILFTLILFLFLLPFLLTKKLNTFLFTRINKINSRLNMLTADLDYPPLDLDYNDEIDEISNHINNLHIRVKAAEQKLRANLNDMEQRVFRRTVQVGQELKERKKAEEEIEKQKAQLLVSDKLKTLGTLVAGVAHEINNPNNFIKLNVPLIKQIVFAILLYLEENDLLSETDNEIAGLEVKELKETLEKLLEGIESGSTRITKIVDSLKRYSKPERRSYCHQPFDLNNLVKNSLPLINGLIKKSTNNFHTEFESQLAMPIGDSSQIEQVIINIIQNSCQALTDKECAIYVRTYNLPEEHSVVFEVDDQGVGIEPEIINKIQDPFFTTKRENGGTGLGLSISTKIIKEHNGQLIFESEVGAGTITKLILPIFKNRGDDENE